VFDSQTKFQFENVMADVYLGIAIAGANTLIGDRIRYHMKDHLSWWPLSRMGR
jgi:hypothetical protein